MKNRISELLVLSWERYGRKARTSKAILIRVEDSHRERSVLNDEVVAARQLSKQRRLVTICTRVGLWCTNEPIQSPVHVVVYRFTRRTSPVSEPRRRKRFVLKNWFFAGTRHLLLASYVLTYLDLMPWRCLRADLQICRSVWIVPQVARSAAVPVTSWIVVLSDSTSSFIPSKHLLFGLTKKIKN